jgi:LPS sulfotransferase NodH/transposase-like protein
VRKALIIASEVRSGSTFIAESIAYHFEAAFGATLFNLTKEHFSGLNEGTSSAEILARFNSLYLGRQEWVATKIMCAALSVIVRESRKADGLMQAFFGPDTHWIIVRRREKVRQAISLAFARKTGDWHVYGAAGADSDPTAATQKETEDALRSILLSDIYLELFKGLISSDRLIEVYYEDFLLEPARLIEHIHDVLGLVRPEGGVKYVDRTKIRRHALGTKLQSDRDFKVWLLENYHAVESIQAPGPVPSAEPARPASGHAAPVDMRVAIVQEFVRGKCSIKSLAEKYATERSLISYWIAKHRHGELEEQIPPVGELAALEAKVAVLQQELSQLNRESDVTAPLDGST